MKNPLIIIGGMGPQASHELHRLILQKSTANESTAGAPEILHASLIVPDFVTDDKQVDAAIDSINNTCSILPLERAVGIGLACNTAHLLVDRLPMLSMGNFISMIDEACEAVVDLSITKVGVLASPSTVRHKLYDRPLRARKLEPIFPTTMEIDSIGQMIRAVISGRTPKEFHDDLTQIARRLQKRGAETILLGCTELPLIGIDTVLPVVSSLDSLATAMVRATRAMR